MNLGDSKEFIIGSVGSARAESVVEKEISAELGVMEDRRNQKEGEAEMLFCVQQAHERQRPLQMFSNFIISNSSRWEGDLHQVARADLEWVNARLVVD